MLVASLLFIAPLTALADPVVRYPMASGGAVNIETPAALGDKLGLVARFFGSLLFAIAVLIFLYAAFLYITAGENEDTTTKARLFLTWGIVGLVVALVAWSLPLLVANILGGRPLN